MKQNHNTKYPFQPGSLTHACAGTLLAMHSRGQHRRTFSSSAGLVLWLGVLSLLVLPSAQCKSLWLEHGTRLWRAKAASVPGGLARSDTLALPRDRGGRRAREAPLTPAPPGQRVPASLLQRAEGEASVTTFATSRPELGAQTLAQRGTHGESPAAQPVAAQLPGPSLGRALLGTNGPNYTLLPTLDIVQGVISSEKTANLHAVHLRGDLRSRQDRRRRRANVGVREAAQAARHEALHQHQEVRQSGAEPHASRMVLTAVSTLAAVVGVCVMAALFQCCCRKKRRGGDGAPADRGAVKAADKEQDAAGGSKRSRSKSPSPVQTAAKDEDGEDKGLSEQDKLLEDDEDLGDFSVVQRETEILRSTKMQLNFHDTAVDPTFLYQEHRALMQYRKPPPPKNRARASRVPRALKTVEPNASPDVFQDLVEDEDQEAEESRDQVKPALKPPPRKAAASDVAQNTGHSSMLDEIDSEIAAIHKDDDKATDSRESPPKEGRESKEAALERVPVAQMDASPQVPRPKPRIKEGLGGNRTQEELTQSLAKELSKAMSKEDLTRSNSKSPSPRRYSRDTSPKSESSGSAPKLSAKGSSASDSTSSQSAEGEHMSLKEAMTSEGSSASRKNREKKKMDSPQDTENVFALIDPTAGTGQAGDKSKSKIPVRAGETTQGSAAVQLPVPLRHTGGKDLKRFPVPSVHGEKMDQLMKSLKTRLKEEDSPPVGKQTSKISPEGNGAPDLDPQSRERAYSDPTKQNAEKASFQSEQTHL